MHVARAFEVRSLILLNHLDGSDPVAVLKKRDEKAYFSEGNWKYSPLYSENSHLALRPMDLHEAREKAKDPLVAQFFGIDS